MLDHAQEAITLVKGKQRSELDSQRVLNLALVRLMEIIGEAASRVSREDQNRFSGIPWPEIISLRNRLIHGYDMVDMDVLWQIVTKDLPDLVVQVKKALKAE